MNEHKNIEGFTGPDEHEKLVRRVLLGEVPREEERVQRLAKDCPPCAQQLREHDQILALLDEGGELEMQSILEEVRRTDDCPGDEQVDNVIRSLAAEEPLATPGGGRWRFRSVAAFLAAAVMLVAAFLIWTPAEAPPAVPGATHLGHGVPGTEQPEERGAYGPVGPGADFREVHWTLDIPVGGVYVLRIYDNTGAERGPLILEVELDEPRWIPDETELAKLTNGVLFEVIRYDGAGRRFGEPFSWSASSGSE